MEEAIHPPAKAGGFLAYFVVNLTLEDYLRGLEELRDKLLAMIEEAKAEEAQDDES